MGDANLDHQSTPRTGVHLDLSQQKLLSTGELQLPSADQMSERIRYRLGDNPRIQLQMCIASDGHVASADVIHGTTMEMFDQAVVRDVATWQFAALPASSQGPLCKPVTIEYRPLR